MPAAAARAAPGSDDDDDDDVMPVRHRSSAAPAAPARVADDDDDDLFVDEDEGTGGGANQPGRLQKGLARPPPGISAFKQAAGRSGRKSGKDDKLRKMAKLSSANERSKASSTWNCTREPSDAQVRRASSRWAAIRSTPMNALSSKRPPSRRTISPVPQPRSRTREVAPSS